MLTFIFKQRLNEEKKEHAIYSQHPARCLKFNGEKERFLNISTSLQIMFLSLSLSFSLSFSFISNHSSST